MIYAVANQKGGVGKTTTVNALGAAFAERGARVLVIDLDPQAGLTISYGVNPDALPQTMYQVLLEKAAASDIAQTLASSTVVLWPANLDLAAIEAELIGQLRWDQTLTQILSGAQDYDVVLIDCPPTLGILTTNALVAADVVIVPVQCEYLAFRALAQLFRIVENIRKKANPSVQVKILRTMYDPRTKHAREVFDELLSTWPKEVLHTFIKRTVKFADASVGGSSILQYDGDSEAAQSYRSLCEELLNGEETPINRRSRRKRVFSNRKASA